MRSDRSHSPEPHDRRIILGVGFAVLIFVALPVSLVAVPVWARWMAVRRMDAGALSEAQRWLHWSNRLAFGDAETELIRAACFRRFGRMDRWQTALESARRQGADPHRWQQEQALGLIRMGAQEAPEDLWKSPAAAGVRRYDAIDACLRGHLARKEPGKAERILEFWAAALPHDADIAYLQGVYWFNQNREVEALREFENAVARQPAHELAHTAVARLLEKQDRLAEALAAYQRFASACARSEIAVVGLAGVLRKMSHVEEARAVADLLGFSSDPGLEFCGEMGSIELDSGNYPQALRWFGQARAVYGLKKREFQQDAAMAFALQEETAVAHRLFEQAGAEESNELRGVDLLIQLAVDPGNAEAADELKRLSAVAAEFAAQSTGIQREVSRVARREEADLTAAELYDLYCTACHGANGDGKGRAARHQFPLPRDFRTESFRLVSTDNTNPTVEDLKRVIKDGMPGTSMREFDHLSEKQLEMLAEEVLRLRREGVREWYIALLEAEDEEIDEEDVQEVVELRSLPGDAVPVPAIGPADPAAVARGREVYLQKGCRPCHGDDGTGPPEVALFDEQGLPNPPRDLVSGPFKGGHEPESIFLRIVTGMPGSAHPATKALTGEEYVDVVHYCGSLSRQPKRTLSNYQRLLEATQRSLSSVIPVAATDVSGPSTGKEQSSR